LVAEIHSVRLRRWIEIGLGTGAEVVENPHLVARRNVRVDHMGTDETGTAGDQNPHRK